MPNTIEELFGAAGVTPLGVTKWGKAICEDSAGVYVVAMTDSVRSANGCLAQAPISIPAVQEWLRVREREFRLDGLALPPANAVAARLAKFWFPDEIVLYVGQTSDSLGNRLDDYYATPLGACRPHSGGHWIQTLVIRSQLFVHYGAAIDPKAAEVLMLQAFCDGASDESKIALHDPTHPFPFANIEWPKGYAWPAGNVKKHGLSGQREPRKRRQRG